MDGNQRAILEPTEAEILELVKQKAKLTDLAGQSWVIDACMRDIAKMEVTIAKLKKLIDLCKNPEVVDGIEIFIGRK